MREIVIGGAQMGSIQKLDSREAVVARMLALLEQAKGKGCDLVVFPELCLTTFFPRWYMEDQAEVDQWFETEMPNAATSSESTAKPICPVTANTTPNARFNTSKNATFWKATPDFLCGVRRIQLWGCVFAMTAVGLKSIVSWGFRVLNWSCWVTTPLR
jgi:hypothetical protein